MLPGFTPVLMDAGGITPAVDYGVDQYTKSLLKFDGEYLIAPPARGALVDFVKPSRAWEGYIGSSVNTKDFNGYFTGTSIQVVGGDGGVFGPVSDADYNQQSGDFTTDFWALTADPSAGIQGTFLTKNNPGGGISPWLFYQDAGVLYFYSSSDGASWDIASRRYIGPITNAAWHHYAVQRKNNVWTTFCDGVLGETWTSSATPITTTTGPMFAQNNGGGSPITIFCDELRFSSVARYSGNFTPQRFPYYPVLNGSNDAATKLLLHFDGDLIDNAAGPAMRSPHVVLVSGSAQTLSTAQSKFGGSSLRSSGATGCLYFEYQKAMDLQPTIGDWTVDFWYYRVAVPASGAQIIGTRSSTANFAGWLLLDMPDGRFDLFVSTDGATWAINAGDVGAIATGQWVHFAMVRSNALGNIQCYRDGSPIGAFTFSASIATFQQNPGLAGCGDGISCNAYIDEFRFSDVARWTAAFTPPTAAYGPDPDSTVKLLLHMEGTNGRKNFMDNSRYCKQMMSLGTYIMSTNTAKFGVTSGVYQAAGDCLYVANASIDPDFAFGTGDFTIDFWMFPQGTAFYVLLDMRAGGEGVYPVIYHSGGRMYYYTNSADRITGTTVLATSIWHHIALARASGVTKLYVNGTQEGASYTDSNNYLGNANRPIIGNDGTSLTSAFNGYIDEVRICKGVAKWTANFTPPTVPYS